LCRAADAIGDFRPGQSLGSQIGQLPFFDREQFAKSDQQFPARNDAARRGSRAGNLPDRAVRADDSPVVSPLPRLTPRGFREFVAGHAHEQSWQLIWLIELVLPGCHADQKTAHHRLANIGSIKMPIEPLVLRRESYFSANQRLIAPNQFRGRLLVAGSDAANEPRKFLVLAHCVPQEC